jgi:hypothetical protein
MSLELDDHKEFGKELHSIIEIIIKNWLNYTGLLKGSKDAIIRRQVLEDLIILTAKFSRTDDISRFLLKSVKLITKILTCPELEIWEPEKWLKTFKNQSIRADVWCRYCGRDSNPFDSKFVVIEWKTENKDDSLNTQILNYFNVNMVGMGQVQMVIVVFLRLDRIVIYELDELRNEIFWNEYILDETDQLSKGPLSPTEYTVYKFNTLSHSLNSLSLNNN